MEILLTPMEVEFEITNGDENQQLSKFEMIAAALNLVQHGYAEASVVADVLASALNDYYNLDI